MPFQATEIITDNIRMRMVGMAEWICPKCMIINRTRIRRGQWRMRCRNSQCHKWFGVGHRIWDLSAYRGHPAPKPTDVIFPVVPVAQLPIGHVRVNEMVSP